MPWPHLPSFMRARGVLAAVARGALALLFFIKDQPGHAGDRAAGAAILGIDTSDVLPHLRFLSSDLLEGRAPSTRGGDLAAEYLATQLSLLGYAPAGDSGTYFQSVPIRESVVDPSSIMRVGEGAPLTLLSEIVAFSGRAEARLELAGEVVFVGYGIVAPEYGWDDYAGVDLTGKIAMVMVNEPRAPASEPMLFGGDEFTYYGRWTYKFEEAARHGAAGALLIHTDASATYPWQVVQASWGGTLYSLPPFAR